MVQKGRSRAWIDDRGWRLHIVEFQPSGWSQGSYLNVACTCLWHVRDYVAFDEGGRIEGFSQFQTDAQFEVVARAMAERAASEVLQYRCLFPIVNSVSTHYLRRGPTGFSQIFNSAVACGLSGQGDEAARRFRRLSAMDDDRREWAIAARSDARHLVEAASDVKQFREIMPEGSSKIARTS
jgi:hypothetical protein